MVLDLLGKDGGRERSTRRARVPFAARAAGSR